VSTQAVNVNPRLAALAAAGCSPWLDLLSRNLVESGELQRMVDEESLRGVTSNPAIFEKSILGSEDYDDFLVELAEKGLDGRETYRALVTRDVQMACDVLRPVWDETNHLDGYVSLEVEPDLAHDAQATMDAARLYWQRVDRPNLMIKIPGTTEGGEAIETAIAEGINVNVTLLFGVEEYAAVAEAFIRGLERRRQAGESLDVHSVASFFVSRVDSEVDKRLDKLGREDLMGKAGLANARAAYQRFQQIFEGEQFATLRAAGAPVQRPLWASTGVKDPKYSDTMYVDGLVAPHTVNTMPIDTLKAVADHGEVKGTPGADDPAADLQALADAGHRHGRRHRAAAREGIEQVHHPMVKLLAGIESKREAIRRRPRFDANLPAGSRAVTRGARAGAREDVARRVWAQGPERCGAARRHAELANASAG
jgi:transaldolase